MVDLGNWKWLTLGISFLIFLLALAFMRVLGGYETAAIPAYNVGAQILSFSFLPGIGFATAAATLVGQHLGEEEPKLAERSGWRSMWGAIVTSRGCVIFYGLRGHVLQSCDAGENWVELESGSQASLSGAAEHQGMLVFTGNSGTVLTWAGGGFTSHQHSSGVDFAAALPLSGGRFLLVGEQGVHRFPESDGEGDER